MPRTCTTDHMLCGSFAPWALFDRAYQNSSCHRLQSATSNLHCRLWFKASTTSWMQLGSKKGQSLLALCSWPFGPRKWSARRSPGTDAEPASAGFLMLGCGELRSCGTRRWRRCCLPVPTRLLPLPLLLLKPRRTEWLSMKRLPGHL